MRRNIHAPFAVAIALILIALDASESVAQSAPAELTVAGGVTCTLGNNSNLRVGGNLNVGSATSSATLVVDPKESIANTYLWIDVHDNLTVAATSAISGTGKGYASQYGPASPTDLTSTINTVTAYAGKDFTGTASSGGGGGHHGIGGVGNSGGAGGLSYGNCVAPITMGAGGGRGQAGAGQYASAGAGGGALKMTVGANIAVNGAIVVAGTNGSAGTTAGGGGGAGGSLFITAQTLSGSGTLSVKGGDGGVNGGAGGSGGHLVVNASITVPPTVVIVGGAGNGGGTNGADGCTNLIPQPPTNLTGIADSTATITWSWTDNSGNETGFVIHNDAHLQVGSVVAGVTQWQEPLLAENTSYSRHVHAVIGSSASDPSNTATRYTLVHDPAVSDFTVTALSSWQIRVDVVAPPNGTSGQTGVKIERSPDEPAWEMIRDFDAVYTIADSPLADQTLFHYRIVFRNGDGIATVVSPIRSAATFAVPVPTIATGAKKTNDTTPLIEGTGNEGFAIRIYEGTTFLGTTTVLSGGAWGLPTDPLSETVHALKATAVDPGLNESSPSSAVNITIDLTPPSAPQELTATAYNGEIHLTWQANTESDLLGYNIYRKAPGEQSFTRINPQVVVGATWCDSGLTNGEEYEYKITAVDDTSSE